MTLTVLKVADEGCRATKKFIWDDKASEWRKEEFHAGTNFWWENWEPGNIFELHKMLTQLESDPDRFVIRGELIPGLPTDQPLVRRCRESDKGKPTFCERPEGLNWICIDFDNVPIDGDLQSDLERIIYLVTLLPDYLQNTTFHYQWSSSYGINGTNVVSAHLWFWLEEARTDKEAYQWAKKQEWVDQTVMRTVQPHFTAAPIIQGGSLEVGERSGLVEFPREMGFIPKISPAEEAIPYEMVNGKIYRKGQSYGPEYYLDKIGEGGHCHEAITQSAASWVRVCGKNPDREFWKAVVRDRVQNVVNPRKKLYMSDDYLNQAWSSAREKFSPMRDWMPPHPPTTPLEALRWRLMSRQKGTE